MQSPVRMICDVFETQEVLFRSDGVIEINVYHLAKLKDAEMRWATLRFHDLVLKRQIAAIGTIGFDPSTFWITRDLQENLSQSHLSSDFLNRLKCCIAQLTSLFHATLRPTYPDLWPDPPLSKGIVRFGNVELRVIQSYIENQEELKASVDKLCSSRFDEALLYSPGKPESYLSSDDTDMNLRSLLTNAGMYLSPDPEVAWRCLSEWCNFYLDALASLPLAAYPPAYPFFFNIQKYIWKTNGVIASYFKHPSPFDFLGAIAGHSLLCVSPLASQINSQVQGGNIQRLFKNYVPLQFSVSAVEAPITTFPNRIHDDWCETFESLKSVVDKSLSGSSYGVFAASCGAYGLPLCHYVSQKYGLPVFYVGNVLHAYFGILQNATKDFMLEHRNHDAWVRGNLSNVKNIERIDAGRYI